MMKENFAKEKLRKFCVLRGMKTLKENAKQLVLEGKTTAFEMSRMLSLKKNYKML